MSQVMFPVAELQCRKPRKAGGPDNHRGPKSTAYVSFLINKTSVKIISFVGWSQVKIGTGPGLDQSPDLARPANERFLPSWQMKVAFPTDRVEPANNW